MTPCCPVCQRPIYLMREECYEMECEDIEEEE